MQHLYHRSVSSASDVPPIRADMLRRDSILSRAAFPNAGSCLVRSANAANADANRSGFRGGTTTPVSPTTSAESPTSVTTHGTPHAIASATAFGIPSPNDEEQHRSRALYADDMSLSDPSQNTLFVRPRCPAR